MSNKTYLDKLALDNFKKFLKIKTMHPNINFDECVKFLINVAHELELPVVVYHFFPDQPIVVITWEGTEPFLPSIMFNGHVDVVPVYEEKWTHDPFGAEEDSKGNIYARGAQDMKCVCIQYLEAVRRLKLKGISLSRTLHFTFMPDEEVGGNHGMKAFLESSQFKWLNVGFVLDEGGANPDDTFTVFYGERSLWKMHFHCPGQSGHGSMLLDNTPGEKVAYLLEKFYKFRAQEKKKLDENPNLNMADVTAVNMTIMQGGVQSNVIPEEFVFVIDSRVAVDVDLKIWEDTLNRWCVEAGRDVHIEYEEKDPPVPVTPVDDSNVYWLAIKKVLDKMDLKYSTQIFPASTDSRHIRRKGLWALGFSPMNKTPFLAHDHDEFLNKDIFLNGIDIYVKLLKSLGNTKDVKQA